MNRSFVRICTKYNLNPSMAQQILYLKSQGFNNQDVADQLGITRQTVYNYVKAIQEMERNDFLRALLLIAGIAGGIALLKELFD